jgi:hypothetical protein
MNAPSSPNLVDKPNQATDRPRPGATDYAENRDLTLRSTLGGGAKRTHPQPSALLRGATVSYSRPSAMTEAALLRGYGLDPETLERRR